MYARMRPALNVRSCAENADEFWFNEHFTSKLHRVKIPMVSGKADTEPETRLTREKVSRLGVSG